MSEDQARQIQTWRKRGSWRWIAERVAAEFPDSFFEQHETTRENVDGNQLYGKELCLYAEAVLNEPVEFEG
jgi:hypothetical protein